MFTVDVKQQYNQPTNPRVLHFMNGVRYLELTCEKKTKTTAMYTSNEKSIDMNGYTFRESNSTIFASLYDGINS